MQKIKGFALSDNDVPKILWIRYVLDGMYEHRHAMHFAGQSDDVLAFVYHAHDSFAVGAIYYADGSKGNPFAVDTAFERASALIDVGNRRTARIHQGQTKQHRDWKIEHYPISCIIKKSLTKIGGRIERRCAAAILLSY